MELKDVFQKIHYKEGFEKPGLLVIPNAFGMRNFETAVRRVGMRI